MRLEHTSPDEAVQLYLDDRRPEVSQSIIYAHRNRLTRFVEWVEEETTMDDMTEMTRQKPRDYW